MKFLSLDNIIELFKYGKKARGKLIMEKKFDDMSKKERLEYLFDLLPDNYKAYSKEDGIKRLEKIVYHKAGRGKPLKEKLKEVGFCMNKYSELEQFLFVLTYVVLTNMERGILKTKQVKKETIYVNQKFISHIKKINVDMKIDQIIIFFLVIADTYNTLEYRDNIVKDKKIEDYKIELIEAFNKQLTFQYREFEKTKEIRTRKKQVSLKDEEIQMLSENANVYDTAYMERWVNEENFLTESLEKVRNCNTMISSLACFIEIINKEYLIDLEAERLEEHEEYFFSYIICMRFFSEAYNIHLLISLAEEDEYSLYFMDSIYDNLFRDMSHDMSIVEKYLKNNIFTSFASHICYLSLVERFRYIRKISDSIDENIELREFNKNEMDKIYFSEKMIREYPTKKLIDYFIPDEKERTSNDRNIIKDRLVYIINFFEYLSTKNPIIRGRGYGRQVKIVYSLIYGNNGKFKLNSRLLKQIYKNETDKIQTSDIIIWTEIYYFILFSLRGNCNIYKRFKEKRNHFLCRCEKMIENILAIEGD